MVEICAIASGSNGNCYYVGNSRTAVLIDAGISCKQILDRMALKNLDPGKVKAIFISHEHTDHFCGARVLGKKLQAPVYMTSRTLGQVREVQRPEQVVPFIPGEVVTIDDFTVYTFLKCHDGIEPCSFRIEHNDINIGVFTDIGMACPNVSQHLEQCHALFMESNYDEDMLWTGVYPYYMKRRIASSYGHLSNRQASDLLKKHRHPSLKVVFLSHLSAVNNRPEMASAAFEEMKEIFHVKVADRNAASEIYTIYPKDILAASY